MSSGTKRQACQAGEQLLAFPIHGSKQGSGSLLLAAQELMHQPGDRQSAGGDVSVPQGEAAAAS